jgi:hypothetical protein
MRSSLVVVYVEGAVEVECDQFLAHHLVEYLENFYPRPLIAQ